MVGNGAGLVIFAAVVVGPEAGVVVGPAGAVVEPGAGEVEEPAASVGTSTAS